MLLKIVLLNLHTVTKGFYFLLHLCTHYQSVITFAHGAILNQPFLSTCNQKVKKEDTWNNVTLITQKNFINIMLANIMILNS